MPTKYIEPVKENKTIKDIRKENSDAGKRLKDIKTYMSQNKVIINQ